MVNENIQLLQAGSAISDSNPMPVSIVPAKATPVTLFGGALAASVAETLATVIDMRKYTKLELQVLINSGAGTWSCAFYTNDVATGVFKLLQQHKSDKSGYETKPALVTITTVSATYEITGILGNYLKIVPTLTSACNATFKATPSL